MANFATAATADRTTVETLIATVQSITTELAVVNAQLVTALATNSTLTSTISYTRQRRPRGRGGGGDRGRGRIGANNLAVSNRVRGPTGRFYCWSCGDYCYHTSTRCCNKKVGHKDEATSANKMDGSAHTFAAVAVA